MEAETDDDNNNNNNNETTISTIKSLRTKLETRIQTQHNTQLDLLASLQCLVPNIVSSLDLSLQLLSSFNNRPFTPIPPLPIKPNNEQKPLDPKPSFLGKTDPRLSPLHKVDNLHEVVEGEEQERPGIGDESMDGASGTHHPLSLVRAMVAVCLLQRVPFTAIDSSTVLRKLENDGGVTPAEKAALRDLGGESGAILAVELALRSMAEDNGGVELEEFVITGKSRVMVVNIDRTKLVKELPETAQQLPQQQPEEQKDVLTGNNGKNNNQNQQQQDLNGTVFGREMWDPHMMGMMGRGRGMMGMMGRGLGMSVMHHGRPTVNAAGMGMAAMGMPPAAPKLRSEEDDLKDLEALLNKKSFMEMQKSKTGEELLDLIHRPTAKETAMAARVICSMPVLKIYV